MAQRGSRDPRGDRRGYNRSVAKAKDFPKAGRSSDAPYCAFGDDSAFSNVLVYSFVVVARERRTALEEEISIAKSTAGIPDQIPIHLNRFFNEHTRRKDEIESVDIPQFLNRIIDVMNEIGTAVFYNFAIIPPSGSFYPDDFEIGGQKIHEDHKSTLHQMAASCFVPFVEINDKLLSAKDFEVYVSQDSTKVRTVGKQRRQAHNMAKVAIPTTNPIVPGSYVRLSPYFVLNRDFVLCQLADCISYCLSHSYSVNCKNPLFSSLLGRLPALYRAPAG